MLERVQGVKLPADRTRPDLDNWQPPAVGQLVVPPSEFQNLLTIRRRPLLWACLIAGVIWTLLISTYVAALLVVDHG